MKANELTEGIYVYFNCFGGSKITVKVTGLKDGVVYGVSEYGTHWCQISKIEPISLTPEILEKNDFEKRWQDVYEYFNDDENLNITFYPKSSNYTNGAYDYIDIEKGCLKINEMPIAFVHELQHALRLCGIEKQIEL